MKTKTATPTQTRAANPARIILPIALALLAPGAVAQPPGPVEVKPDSEIYRTLYLTNLTQQYEANDLLTAMRNVLTRARLYYLPSQGAISIRGSAADIQLAETMLSDLDRPRKTYRLTFTLNDTDAGKRTDGQHFTLIATSGEKTDLKQGNKVPVLPATVVAGQTSQVEYIDVGLAIEATLDGSADGFRLHSKVSQSSVADEKAPSGIQDPVIHQTELEGTYTLLPGKPLVLGSLDVPGSTRHQQIEVVAELLR